MAYPGSGDFELKDGSRIAVIGSGPAGSFFCYFLLQLGQRMGLKLQVDIYEPKDFTQPGPRSCNMCGGIVSESLVQNLAGEGIHLPQAVVQRSIDSYYLHMDVGSVRIQTPGQEKRIASVHRGGGPRGIQDIRYLSFDGFLLDLAVKQGARQVNQRVDDVEWDQGRPRLKTAGQPEPYDLLVVASGINSYAPKLLEGLSGAYRPPQTTKAYIAEYFLGKETIKTYLGSAMHVFLLDLPRLEFAALIPKGDYVTLCLLGWDIDKPLVDSFLSSSKVKECLPPNWEAPDDFCHCSPRLNIQGAVQPFGDRIVFIGDAGVTRLYKDGIGAAFRTAKAAARTAVLHGVASGDFRKHYWPACRSIARDNAIGKLVFFFSSLIKKLPFTRRGVWRMVSHEQRTGGANHGMSSVMWDTFTGSAPYQDVFLRTLHPAFLGRFLWEILAGAWPRSLSRKKRREVMISGVLGRYYRDGEMIFRQGDAADCMFVVQRGQVEILRREEDREYCLAELGEEEFFGEMALFGQEVRDATARAVGDACVLSVERASFLRRVHEDPGLAFRMMEKMAHRVKVLEKAMVRSATAA
jgi:flavin-dependent dehydrogenase